MARAVASDEMVNVRDTDVPGASTSVNERGDGRFHSEGVVGAIKNVAFVHPVVSLLVSVKL